MPPLARSARDEQEQSKDTDTCGNVQNPSLFVGRSNLFLQLSLELLINLRLGRVSVLIRRALLNAPRNRVDNLPLAPRLPGDVPLLLGLLRAGRLPPRELRGRLEDERDEVARAHADALHDAVEADAARRPDVVAEGCGDGDDDVADGNLAVLGGVAVFVDLGDEDHAVLALLEEYAQRLLHRHDALARGDAAALPVLVVLVDVVVVLGHDGRAEGGPGAGGARGRRRARRGGEGGDGERRGEGGGGHGERELVDGRGRGGGRAIVFSLRRRRGREGRAIRDV